MTDPSCENTPSRLLAAWIGLLLGGILGAVAYFLLAVFAGSPPSPAVVIGAGCAVGAAIGWALPRPVRAIGSAILSLLP